MTVVEFFDSTPFENIIGSITADFNKIIFLGERKRMDEFKDIYEVFAQKRGLEVEILYRPINRNNLSNIVDALSEIVEAEEQCLFDLTGGEDLALVAMGIVYQKYQHKNIQMQHFNVNNGRVEDCDNDGRVIIGKEPKITIEEFIGLHGGVIKYADENIENDTGTYRWKLSDDFINDIDVLWEMCRQDPKRWNNEIGVISKICELSHNRGTLSVTATHTQLERCFKNQTNKLVDISDILINLQKNKLISELSLKNGVISFTFKNKQIKKCLDKEGTALELKVLTAAMAATRKDQSKIYDECMNGVFIDWDGGEHNKNDTFNEIDVILLAGVKPIFISCKNGQVDYEELYKLETVANQFGGENVKKILIATYLGKNASAKDRFAKRAADMGIELIDQVHTLKKSYFNGMIKQLVNIKRG